MFVIKVNGTKVSLFDNDVELTYNDIATSDSGRSNITGIMFKKTVRQVWNIKLHFTKLDENKVSQIMNLFKSSDNLDITFSNPYNAYKEQTESFYTGDITIKGKQVGERFYSDLDITLHQN